MIDICTACMYTSIFKLFPDTVQPVAMTSVIFIQVKFILYSTEDIYQIHSKLST